MDPGEFSPDLAGFADRPLGREVLGLRRLPAFLLCLLEDLVPLLDLGGPASDEVVDSQLAHVLVSGTRDGMVRLRRWRRLSSRCSDGFRRGLGGWPLYSYGPAPGWPGIAALCGAAKVFGMAPLGARV
jgi:hypothetical protein